jgi:NADH-quinone oxidoreductase subunit A
MLRDYAPILLLVVMVVGFAGVNLLLSDLLGRKRASIGKDKAYESGMEPVGNARVRLSIHFYLVAVLFILFDVELIFLVPWAVSARELGPAGFGMVAVFLVVLLVGLIYEWRAGGLEWDR